MADVGSSVSVTVKWGKETYKVDIDPSEPPSVTKAALYSLTLVPPERQKLMCKVCACARASHCRCMFPLAGGGPAVSLSVTA